MSIPVNEVTVEPTIEPVTVPEVKENAFIVDDTSADLLIKKQYIPEARKLVEKLANRSLITQTRAQYYDSLEYEMFLRYGPVQSISSVTYKDSNESSQTLTSTKYTLDAKSIPARLNIGYNETYPLSITDTNSVVVTMVSGYGSTIASVPLIYRRAIIMWATILFNNRSPIACGDGYEKSLAALQQMLAIEGATPEYA
tara:strand:- start:4799 stop:5392 length:594 start_codon:yes stop_codon:yes gene_type:complete